MSKQNKNKLSESEKKEFFKCVSNYDYEVYENEFSEFGITDICVLAGWILPDGDMVDLGYGGKHGYSRVRDHREIQNCLPDKISDRSDVLSIAQKELGLVRMSMYDDHTKQFILNIDLESDQNITNSQKQTLKRCVKDWDVKSIYYDLYHKNTNVVDSLPDIDEFLADEQLNIIFRFKDYLNNGYTTQEIHEIWYNDY